MRILLATDGSDYARGASDCLAALSLPEGSEIIVASVLEPVTPPVSTAGDGALSDSSTSAILDAAQRIRCEDALKATRERLTRSGISVSCELLEGQPAERILHLADVRRVGLIVVGSRGLTGIDAFLLGSVARNVAKHAHVPVLVARRPKDSLRRVVLATDGSEHAWQATEFTARLPLPADCRLTVVNVQRPFHPFGEMSPSDAGEYQRAVEEVRAHRDAQSRKTCDTAQSRLAAAGKTALTELRAGDATEEILAVADEQHADLIIVGARGVSMLKGLVVGSVADRLLKTATRSVLIVH